MAFKPAPFIEKSLSAIEGVKKILIVDGDDSRALEAAKILKDHDKVEVTLLVEKDIPNLDVKTINIHANKSQYEGFVTRLLEIRKGKETEEAVRAALKTRPYYAMMLLKSGMFDGVVGGLVYTSADILRSVFKVIGPRSGTKTISSLMLMVKGEEVYTFTDISINVNPTSAQLVEIANNTANFLEVWNIKPRPAFLSFSTQGSAVTEESKKVSEATKFFNLENPHRLALGEIQFDAAFDKEVLAKKYKNPEFNEPANIFIFPDINAGNIGYKIAQRMGNWEAYGPIVTGAAMPVNDLSRGASLTDLVNTIFITAIQAKGTK
ncbi:phosphate acetyltransferase [Mycoplasmopsis agassizii]|uniref:Phosphate acetyltransferase n=1 Tax=Mycoplasmopsis agassizii TaxID=33922 RepID=A0A269TJA9_9BACT|nr:phosphotransacetylase [Mycoplasmopsis agassizii]PAK21572.1 phosphate acetyltransferase [Mycoplasmopsis agassizii]